MVAASECEPGLLAVTAGGVGRGLVDPLQLGAYARSIASIATQLGLPPWLVELRHAATHEDLPSIELLRQAGRDVSRIRVILSP